MDKETHRLRRATQSQTQLKQQHTRMSLWDISFSSWSAFLSYRQEALGEAESYHPQDIISAYFPTYSGTIQLKSRKLKD